MHTKHHMACRRWSDLIADGSMTSENVQQLKSLLQGIRTFPVVGQQWASLADGLMVNDDPNVASLFEGIRGVVLLALPSDPSRSVQLQPKLVVLQQDVDLALQDSLACGRSLIVWCCPSLLCRACHAFHDR